VLNQTPGRFKSKTNGTEHTANALRQFLQSARSLRRAWGEANREFRTTGAASTSNPLSLGNGHEAA
jgi:hypothetical protein